MMTAPEPGEASTREPVAVPYLALTERKARQWAETGEVPWPFDIGRLMDEYDRRGHIAEAAGALVVKWHESNWIQGDTRDYSAVFADLLDALVRAVRTGERG